MEEEAWNELLREVDKNGDGQINLSEFLDLLMKTFEKDMLIKWESW